MPFARRSTKVLKGEDWTEFYEYYKEMSKAARVKKPNENQKAKALWKMKATMDRREDFYDPERKDNIVGRNKTRLERWEEHLKDPIVALDKALKCVENSCWRVCWPENLVEGATSNGRRTLPPKSVGEASLGVRLALLGSDG